MDCSLTGFSIHGVFQARVLDWVAISFSTMCLKNTIKWVLTLRDKEEDYFGETKELAQDSVTS